MTSLLIDGIILTALVAALAWGMVLARRVARLQAALVELAPALQAFCDAVEQSEQSLEEIRRETDRMQEEHGRIGAARSAQPAVAQPREGEQASELQAIKAAAKTDRTDLVRRFFEAARIRQDG